MAPLASGRPWRRMTHSLATQGARPTQPAEAFIGLASSHKLQVPHFRFDRLCHSGGMMSPGTFDIPTPTPTPAFPYSPKPRPGHARSGLRATRAAFRRLEILVWRF